MMRRSSPLRPCWAPCLLLGLASSLGLAREARFEFDNRAKIPFAHRIARGEIKQQSQSWCLLHLCEF
jgi:hypothetical protein